MEKKVAPTFEQAAKRLQELTQSMESGTLALDDMVAAFEEGTRLIAFCTEKLNAVERRVELLTAKSDGTIEKQPFESDCSSSQSIEK